MQTISYKQACELLGVKYVTIKDAVLYGRLTKCAGVSGSLLLREQVELFRGKKISLSSLTLEERKLYDQYKKIAENADTLKIAMSEIHPNTIPAAVAQQIKAKGKAEETINEIINHLIHIIIELRILNIDEEKELSYPH